MVVKTCRICLLKRLRRMKSVGAVYKDGNFYYAKSVRLLPFYPEVAD